MSDAIARIEERIRQIQSLLGEPARTNEEFGKELTAGRQAVNGGGTPSRGPWPSGATAAAYQPMVDAAADRTGLPADLIAAVIGTESGFRPDARSSTGAQGLMQLMPGTAHALGVSDPFDPAQNILGGSEYLRQQWQRFGSLEKALAAYNAGPGAVEKHGGVPPYPETQNYVRRVLQRLRRPTGLPDE